MCCMGSSDVFGGINTLNNTMGVGDLVPAGAHTLGNDFCQTQPGKRRQRRNITNISMKRPAPMPFVTPGTNDGFSSMGPRPLYVPSGNGKRR